MPLFCIQDQDERWKKSGDWNFTKRKLKTGKKFRKYILKKVNKIDKNKTNEECGEKYR